MENEFVNKVSESGLITIDLASFYPNEDVLLFDLQPFLFMGLILKEKDFREALKQFDFTIFQDKVAAVNCSADAIIPMWAYMLAATYLQPYAKEILFGNEAAAKAQLLRQNLQAIDIDAYTDKRLVIKGCGDLPIGEDAYLTITKLLRPVAKSIMYGEPCSTVPIYKKK